MTENNRDGEGNPLCPCGGALSRLGGYDIASLVVECAACKKKYAMTLRAGGDVANAFPDS